MLVLVDKPVIQYGVEEAVASGVDNIVIVTGRGKNAIEDHFDVNVELESFLEQRGKKDQLAEIRKISQIIKLAYVRQGEPLGLGHAVLVTRNLVGDEPFAVILGDDVIDANPPALRQMIDVYHRVDGPCSRSSASRWRTSPATASSPSTSRRISGPGVHRITDLVEKPRREEAPVESGYHRPLHSHSRHFSRARRHGQRSHGRNSTDERAPPPAPGSTTLRVRSARRVRHDTGNKLGFLKALVYFALDGRISPSLSAAT